MTETIQSDGLAGGAPSRRSEILRPAQIFDPVARALDLIGDRWTLVLVRQLLGGPKGFQELRVRTGIAPREYRAGEAVYSLGEPNRGIYCVSGGTVGVRKIDADGNAVSIEDV